MINHELNKVVSSPLLEACKQRLKDSTWGMLQQVLIGWARPEHFHVIKICHCGTIVKTTLGKFFLERKWVNSPEYLGDSLSGFSLSDVDSLSPSLHAQAQGLLKDSFPEMSVPPPPWRRVPGEGHLSCRVVDAFVSTFICLTNAHWSTRMQALDSDLSGFKSCLCLSSTE